MDSLNSTYPIYPLYDRDKRRAQQRAGKRDKTQDPQQVLETIGVKPGMTIGEVGAGEGYYTFPLSRLLGNNGRVYANEIHGAYLQFLRTHIQLNGFKNITLFPGQSDTPAFPENKLDLVLMVRVFHELKNKENFLHHLKPSLKQGGLLAIIQWDKIKMGMAKDPVLLLKEELIRIVTKAGWEIPRIETFLPQENIYICQVQD